MNEIAKLRMPKLNKAPKHKLSMLRNMACSLIKYERVESTDGKARCLAIYMKRIFDVIYEPSLPDHIKNSKLQSMIPHNGALIKLKDNLLSKLKNSRNKEISIYFNRIKATNNHKMMIVEFDKNDKKRKEDKKFLYFTQKINKPFIDFDYDSKHKRLQELFNYHILISNLLKKIYSDLSSLFSSKKVVAKADIFLVINKNYDLLPDNLKLEDVKGLLVDELRKCQTCPKNAYDFLLIFRRPLSLLNAEINHIKASLSHLDSIKQDEKQVFDYNKRIYEYYYKNEFNEYDLEYQKSYEIMSDSKKSLRALLHNLKAKEAEKKKAILTYTKTSHDNPSETELSIVSKIKNPSKRVNEFRKTYSKYYVTGDESGFSDLEDIRNKPKSVVQLKNMIKKEMSLKTNGRAVKREYNRLV